MSRPDGAAAEAADERCWYGADDGGPECAQCGSSSRFRWPERWRRYAWYCLNCWEEYGSEAATVMRSCLVEPQLRAHRSAPLLFRGPPDRCSGRPPLGLPQPREVTPEDSLQAAARLLQDTGGSPLPPIVLNMANADWVGGGFFADCSGQEEELCRRSNLMPQLLEADRSALYPIPELGAIVTADVVVFRSREEGAPYRQLAEPFRVAVITAAAPRRPDLTTAEAVASYRVLMQAKVDALLSVIEHLGYVDVVLSAWGCGAFRNPPGEVACIFREALDGRFRGSFRRVVFAVFDRPDLEEGNCAVFRKLLL